MIETREKIIEGAKYTVTQMTARRAIKMKAKLIRLFGAALAEIFLPSNETPIEGAAFSKVDAVNAIQKLALQLDENTLESLIVTLLQGVRKEGVELTESTLDLEFAGKLDVLYKVLWFVLEVNFESFFGEGGIGSLFLAPAPQQPQATSKTFRKN